MRALPDRVGLVGFDKANARLLQLIDNVLEISCGYCKSFMTNNHPILVMYAAEPADTVYVVQIRGSLIF